MWYWWYCDDDNSCNTQGGNLAGDGKDAGDVINHGCDGPGEDDDNTAKVGSEK